MNPGTCQGEVAIAFFLPNLEAGGAERAIVALANGIANLDVTVDLVLAEAEGPYLAEVLPKVRIVSLSSTGKWNVIARLARYLTDHRPCVMMSCLDLSNIQLIVAAKLARFTGRTVLGQRATIAPVYTHYGMLHRLAYSLAIRVAYPRADFVICNSYAAAAEVRAIAGMRAAKVIALHNGVDAERINRLADEPLADDWFLKSRAPVILSVGSVTSVKDRATLVRAFAIVKSRRKVRLAIVGAHPETVERHKIESLIAQLDLTEHVHLAGFDANPFKWMRRAAVLVSSSITEGCPNQLLEGLALGVPIVATDCPGDTAELLQHGKWGRLVPVADPQRMAEAILATLDDASPPRGYLRAADFAPAKVTAAYLNVLLPQFDHVSQVARGSMYDLI
jgi:glycosyltransferase involved in cell wall biosynthesis